MKNYNSLPEKTENTEETKRAKEAPPKKMFFKYKNDENELSIPQGVLFRKQLEGRKTLRNQTRLFIV